MGFWGFGVLGSASSDSLRHQGLMHLDKLLGRIKLWAIGHVEEHPHLELRHLTRCFSSSVIWGSVSQYDHIFGLDIFIFGDHLVKLLEKVSVDFAIGIGLLSPV